MRRRSGSCWTRALARALLGPRPDGRRRPGGWPSASVRGYRAWQAAQQAKAPARGRLRAVAVDGKPAAQPAAPTAPGSTCSAPPNTAAGSLLDHLEVDVKHNETSHFTELLGPRSPAVGKPQVRDMPLYPGLPMRNY